MNNNMIKYLIILVLIINISCSSSINNNGRILVDRYNKEHEYDIDREPVNDKTVLYCKIHYEWETIRLYYTTDGLKYNIRKDT